MTTQINSSSSSSKSIDGIVSNSSSSSKSFNCIVKSKITSIERINNNQIERGLGYLIHTTHGGYIRVVMDKQKTCCEKFGVYVMKGETNMKKALDQFIGKEIVRVLVSPLKKKRYDGNEDQARWVELYLKDDSDPLMLYVYNQHNGYYPHDCSIEWKGQVVPDENLLFSL